MSEFYIFVSKDRDLKFPGGLLRGEKDEDFSGRIKDFEDKLREQAPQEKKPKDLLRAIGKIETTDWNVKEIEKKINENKQGKVNKEKERVPKWSSEQVIVIFLYTKTDYLFFSGGGILVPSATYKNGETWF